MEQIEKIFKIRENHTTVKTEIIAGLTTFMTMAYIIALNPNLLTGFGAEGQNLWNGVFLATCIASFIGMMVMAFVANKPFAMAPGMGLNSFCCSCCQYCWFDGHELSGVFPVSTVHHFT